MQQISGKNWTDIFNPTGVFLIVSDRLINILKQSNITGWQYFPIDILDKKKNKIEGYQGFSITGKCGSIDYKASEVFEKRLAPNAPISRYYKGMHFDLSKWDGSDFFVPENTFYKIVTERTKVILEENKITNASFENLSDSEIAEITIPNR